MLRTRLSCTWIIVAIASLLGCGDTTTARGIPRPGSHAEAGTDFGNDAGNTRTVLEIPGRDVPIADLTIEDIYIELSKVYPNNVFSQYNTNNDETQRGKDEDWSARSSRAAPNT